MRGLVSRGLHSSRLGGGRIMSHATKAPNPLSDIGFGFSAGGLLFPYYVGLASGLKEAKVLVDATKVAGASAGSLIAALCKSGVP